MASPQAPEIYQKPLADFPGGAVSQDAHAQEVITTISLGYAVKGWTAAVTVVDGMVRVIGVPEAGIAPREYLLGLLHAGFIEDALPGLEAMHGIYVPSTSRAGANAVKECMKSWRAALASPTLAPS